MVYFAFFHGNFQIRYGNTQNRQFAFLCSFFYYIICLSHFTYPPVIYLNLHAIRLLQSDLLHCRPSGAILGSPRLFYSADFAVIYLFLLQAAYYFSRGFA